MNQFKLVNDSMQEQVFLWPRTKLKQLMEPGTFIKITQDQTSTTNYFIEALSGSDVKIETEPEPEPEPTGYGVEFNFVDEEGNPINIRNYATGYMFYNKVTQTNYANDIQIVDNKLVVDHEIEYGYEYYLSVGFITYNNVSGSYYIDLNNRNFTIITTLA